MSQGSGTMSKTVSGVKYLTIFLVLVSMAFFGVCTPQMYDNTLPGIAGSVENEDITQREFIRAYERQSQSLRQQYGEDFNPAMLNVAANVLDELIKERAIYLKAKQLGLEATENDVIKYLDSAAAFTDEKGNFSSENFKNFLRSNGYSEASLMADIRRRLTLGKLQEKIISLTFVSPQSIENEFLATESKMNVEYLKINTDNTPMQVADAEIQAFIKDTKNEPKINAWYQSHTSDFDKEARVKASHILISYKEARNASPKAANRKKAEAKVKAQEVLNKLKDGASFVDLAKAETDEPNGKQSGGDLGFFTKDDMVKEFSDAAFKLKKGELSDVVETPFGFHIIKVNDIQKAIKVSLEDAKETIAKKLILQKNGPAHVNEYSKKILDQLLAGKDAKDLLNSHNLKWQKTGPFSLSSRYISGLGNNQEFKDALLSLSKKSPLHKVVIKSGKDSFIVRLIDVTRADISKLTEDKKKQIENSLKYSLISSAISDLQTKSIEEFERMGAIKKSEKYLALDSQKMPSES